MEIDLRTIVELWESRTLSHNSYLIGKTLEENGFPGCETQISMLKEFFTYGEDYDLFKIIFDQIQKHAEREGIKIVL